MDPIVFARRRVIALRNLENALQDLFGDEAEQVLQSVKGSSQPEYRQLFRLEAMVELLQEKVREQEKKIAKPKRKKVPAGE